MSEYDSLNIRVTDLALGYIFEYDLQTWEVVEEFEYDWGNSEYTKEFKISSGRDERFLSVDVDDSVEIAVWQKIETTAIDLGLNDYIIKNDEPPRSVSVAGVTYNRTEESLGYWRNTRSSNWSKFINWDYVAQDQTKVLSIERWGEEEFEAATGTKVKEYEISNILPREGQPKRAPRDYEEKKKKSSNFFWILIIGLAFVIFGATRCSSGGSSEFKKNPIDEITQAHLNDDAFSVILYDMDVTSSGWSKDYMHKYTIISTKDSISDPEQSQTDWLEVDKKYFEENENNLGMELVSKSDGKLNKTVAPAGYGAYVGNEKYGQWQTNSSGQSFWSFYGKYMFFSSVLNMATRPIYRSYYTDYRSNYYGRSAYYGPTVGGSSYYGTNSSYTQKARPDFYQRKAQRTSSSSSRNSRSGSRYSSGSSYRSRGGGFGK